MVRDRVDQADDGYQNHSHEQRVRPAVVAVARCGLRRHGSSGLKEDYGTTGGGQEKNSPSSRLSGAAYLLVLSRRNATSVTHGMVTGKAKPRPEAGQQTVCSGEEGPLKCLAWAHGMMENTSSRFRVGAITDLKVVCNWKGLDCFFGKPGLAGPFRLTRAAVHRFSIVASWQECARQRGKVGVQVQPYLHLGPTEERRAERSMMEFGSCGQLPVLKDLGMNGNWKAAAGCEVPCAQ